MHRTEQGVRKEAFGAAIRAMLPIDRYSSLMRLAPARKRVCVWIPVSMVMAAAAGLVGCTTDRFYETRPAACYPDTAPVPDVPFPPRALPMFEGSNGRVLTWTDLMQGVFWADVVLLGEQHDDAVGHAVQLAVVTDTLTLDLNTAISLEMLERNEQVALNDYLAGRIDAATFTATTGSASWGSAGEGKSGWDEWYLPIIDQAKRRGTPVIAANAPREFVRMARIDGWAALEALPPEQQAYFSLPLPVSNDAPEQRFAEFMRSNWARHASATATAEGTSGSGAGSGSGVGAPAPTGPSAETIAATWRSQSLWDATMADSISEGLGPWWDRTRVIHLVGQFHSDAPSGLVQQLRARQPFAKVLTVSLRPRREKTLQAEDQGVADVVIYTGWDGRDDRLPTG